MKARFGLILAFAALFSGWGCAAGGGGGSQGPAAIPGIPGGQGEVLAEGIRPRDNSFTRAAGDLLDEAMSATDDAEKASLAQEALQQSLTGIAEDPENPKSYFQAAVANVQLKDYVGADSMFTRAETLHPRYVLEIEPWRERGWVDSYNEGIVPLNAGDLETAAEIFEGGYALYDKRHEGLLQLGSIYSRMGRYEESADAFRAARGLLEESRELALADTAQAGTWQEHWGIAQEGFAQSLQLSGQLQEAADLYGSLLEENPNDAGLLGSLASILSEMEMPDSVDALYNNLLNRPGLTEYDLSNAGVGLYRIEQYDRAAEAFARAAEMNPLGRDARLNLAQTHFQAENWAEVIPTGRDLLGLDPLNGIVYIYMTRAASELEDTEQANAIFNEYQALGYEIESIMLDGQASGGTVVTGSFKNNTAEPGGTVTLRFTFGNQDGREIGNIDIRVQIPAAEESVEFMGEFRSSEFVGGYRYEVVG